jgi:hypothetical protein
MKIINYIYLLFFASILIFGCNSKTDLNPEVDKMQDNIVSKFLNDVKSFESDTNTNPIVTFKELAEEMAEDKIVLSKKNIKKVLIKSKEYSNSVIVTGNHTIVKILSFDNCQQSGSWKACMPKVEGYIKKRKLNYKKDFMNNVIGKPDKQERVAYFFNSDEIISKTKADSYEQAPPLTYNENGNMKVNGEGFENLNKRKTGTWESPKNLFLIDDFYTSIVIRADARYYRPDGLNEEEINWIENTDTLQWWVLPKEGIAKKVKVKKNLIYSTKLCGDFGNFYATELDYDPKDISLACLGNPPESWFKKGPKCIISKDEATQLINANLPIKFQNVNNMVFITETIAGWDGYVNWCCPKEDNPLYENVDEMSIVEYRIPVNVSLKSKVTIGVAKAHIFGGEGSMHPSLKRDIDGDGILEVFWTGCQNYWTHNNKIFVSNVGDCCGC